jgi:uncharacterized protein YfiM (DUF2279 family)
MRQRLAAIGSAILLAAVVQAQDRLTGRWQGTTQNGFEVVLELEAAKTTLTGTLTRNGQTSTLQDGRISEDTFTFKATLGAETESFTGRHDGDEIRVWLDRQGPERAVRLTRVKR